jgi:hypothetical protein
MSSRKQLLLLLLLLLEKSTYCMEINLLSCSSLCQRIATIVITSLSQWTDMNHYCTLFYTFLVQRKSTHILNTYQEIYFNAQKRETGMEIIT